MPFIFYCDRVKTQFPFAKIILKQNKTIMTKKVINKKFSRVYSSLI